LPETAPTDSEQCKLEQGIPQPEGRRREGSARAGTAARGPLDEILFRMHIIRMRTKKTSAEGGGPAPSLRDLSSFRIALLLREINAYVNAKVAGELEASGLTMPQITAIRLIAHAGEPTMSELGAGMNASPSTVAGIVDRLAAAGIVERRRNASDRRIVRVAISPGGGARANRARLAMETCFSKAFAALGDAELSGVERGLDAILSSFRGERRAGTDKE
jgi:MarR family transcriptional regulator, organic hydroperoxide resistance regulator